MTDNDESTAARLARTAETEEAHKDEPKARVRNQPDRDMLGGRSLHWVRRIKGERPHYLSARQAMEDAGADRTPYRHGDAIPIGAVVFYDTPHGDVGLYVGNDTVAMVDMNGNVRCHHLTSRPGWGAPVCWSWDVAPR